MTTLFENRQSAFQGVQENFVNTSAGNLTFLVRDLVRVGGMPIVVGRVYDSALAGGDAARDFGPGWKLAVRESLSEHGGRLVYTDASNAEYLLEVNGGDIVPAVPALAPVSSGRLHRTPGFSVAELRAGDMVRHFVKRHPHGRGASSRPDGPWRLTLVRHPRGWLRIDWRGELVAGLESDAGTVAFDRRADGRIVAARDDLGRAVGYDYDERGRLAAVTDLAGGLWSYGYDAEGALTAVADPRGKTVLAASHADGRTATVRALHAETAFHYGNGTTRAVDGLGRTTTFHRNPDGITTGVADAAGRLAQVAFDAELRPVSVSRDGAAVAYMDYDAAGRLAALRRPDGDSTFGHGDHGLTSVDGAETARYRYAAGRLVHAADAGGERGYAYTDDGVLASATAGGVETELATRPNGVVHELRRDGERLLGIEHRPDGRVVSMARGDGGVPNTVRYDYDARGFRTAAEYGGRVSSALGYDAAGNLVRYELATGGRTVLSQDYEIGDYNEVVRIRTGEGPDVSYEYDSAGRLTTALAGTRTATVAYDDLDRAVRVGLDGGTLATYGYAREDADAALAADRITSATPVPAGTSAVFGTMETVVYTRPAPMHFGPVVYEPALRTFVATHRHLVPDAVLASSLDRRMLPWRGGDVDGRPFGTDKPSGSLFIPPEYRSVNCFVCTASLESVSVSVTVVPVAGVSLSIILGAGGTCMIDEGGSQGGGFGAPVGPSWSHSVTFGDGGTATATGAPATAKHTYASPGEYEIRSDVTCSPCLSVLVLGTATETVEVKQCADSGSPTKIKTLSISAIPREYPDFIKGGHAWGTTRVGFDTSGVACHEICNDGEIAGYRVGGSLNYASTSTIRNARKVWAVNTCTVDNRTGSNKGRTKRHEEKHATYLTGSANNLITDQRSNLDKQFSTLTACKQFLDTFVDTIESKLRDEVKKQKSHLDFRGQAKYTAVCETAYRKTKERNCTDADVSCPDGERW